MIGVGNDWMLRHPSPFALAIFSLVVAACTSSSNGPSVGPDSAAGGHVESGGGPNSGGAAGIGGGSGGAIPNGGAGSGGIANAGGSGASGGGGIPSSGGTTGTGGAPNAGGTPSAEAMPTGDLPGWKLVFSDDFVTDASLGSFPGSAYEATWTAYPDGWQDTSKNGQYSPGKTLSVKSGVLSIDVHTENGIHYVSAPEPMKGVGQLYGRYSVRFRVTAMTPDYKTAWLLWPDSDKWPDDGEIDFPEGNLDGTISAFAHHANPAGGQDPFSSSVTYDAWHTATTEWSQGKVTFYLDGSVLGTSTTMVPSKPMHYVMQTETNLDGHAPTDASVGNIEVDWVVIWGAN
jgi:hypothetical protein